MWKEIIECIWKKEGPASTIKRKRNITRAMVVETAMGGTAASIQAEWAVSRRSVNVFLIPQYVAFNASLYYDVTAEKLIAVL
jgi:hypothetical protein